MKVGTGEVIAGRGLLVLLMAIIAVVSLWVLRRVDLDEILGKV